MESKELRIGNIVSTIYGKFNIQVVKEIKEYVISTENINGLSLGSISPIPLTEEWLLKFGFKKSKLEGYDVHFKYSHQKLHTGICAIYNCDFSLKLDDVARAVKYVHQLQNLFFALTGEELKS